jgi:hypothetical protein
LPSVSIFAVFRRQRYDDSVKPAFLFSSTFLPISSKLFSNALAVYKQKGETSTFGCCPFVLMRSINEPLRNLYSFLDLT